ncbi:glutathione synthetase-like [Boleophthalmus pectinirostris]|uniref:glutathione synthetase-like n=1 Tax=Boleophthalmus pectinirostris TaxID=150288 RepID=UPI002430C49E|nr:glutathione synthetase-like [Boleophthalmus pectinirostris]
MSREEHPHTSRSGSGPFDALLRDEALLHPLLDFARDAACLRGILLKPPDAAKPVTHMPFTLVPTPVSRALYLQALQVQTFFNTLVDRVSQDQEFLEEALSSTVEVDDFTARLFHIYKQIQREGRAPSIVLGLTRCDYMLDRGSSLKQVEINTFAAGMGEFTEPLVEVYRDVLRFAGRPKQSEQLQHELPSTGHAAAAAVAKAWELYGSHRAVVLLVVLPSDFYRFGQRCLEVELPKWNISVMRRSLDEVSASVFLDKDDRLFVEGREIAVVYFRYGYAPEHYTEQLWDVRLLLEQSRAVKCPDVGTHLAGTKKVQQVLSEAGVLERFFPQHQRVVEQIRATFTGLYSLDPGAEGDRVMDLALAAPERFVLKPQREGGGNNFFGSDIRRVLSAAGGKDRRAFILMDKIQATSTPNILVSGEHPPVVTECTCELGVAGAYVRRGSEILSNQVVGVLLRSKMAAAAEGGVSSGGGAISAPFLL